MKNIDGGSYRTALLCSFEKDEALTRLATILHDAKWQLLGSAGTAAFLSGSGIPCRDVAAIVGAPILGHRVVTLAREIYAGLLSRDEDTNELKRLNVPRIDLVYVTLYPLERSVADPASTPENVIEHTDIGGPTLLRAAAKGRRIVLSSAAQLGEFERRFSIEQQLDENYIVSLAAAAERRVSEYAGISASYWEQRTS